MWWRCLEQTIWGIRELCSDKPCELGESTLHCTTGLPLPFPAGFPANADDVEAAGSAVHGEIEPRDQAVAVEEWHDEIAPAPQLRDVDLEPEIEVPERLRPGAIADEIVEWRQKRGPRREVPCLDALQERDVLGVDEPVALDAERHRHDGPVAFEIRPDALDPRVPAAQEMALDLLHG